MAWYDEAIFYHIYPIGLLNAPKQNHYEAPVHRLPLLKPWIDHIKDLGFTALYLGPLFQSVGHGYETTDYYTVDSRLGTNDDLTDLIAYAHKKGIKVILDGVFNHTGRDFFAFQDLKKNRENSPYKDWYCNVNFWNNNSYNDGFSYDNWGGYDLLVKLNQWNPAVKDYIADVIRFWVREFDIDGLRLDAADVLQFDFMKMLRSMAGTVKPDFYLMGEVIHGEYNRWVNPEMLHAVTNYHLHKALYSGHNDHNYFEIAHTVKRLLDQRGGSVTGLYNFVDNHDVERIHTKLNNKDHMLPVHILLYTLPGVPSVYYGSEYGIDGRKERGSDDSLRPSLDLSSMHSNDMTNLLCKLGHIRQEQRTLSYGSYQELFLATRQYAFARTLDKKSTLITVNNDEQRAWINIPDMGWGRYVGVFSGRILQSENGRLNIESEPCSGEIWIRDESV